ncbi:hypothetical protein CMV_026736, partial [Castanea mollissima]
PFIFTSKSLSTAQTTAAVDTTTQTRCRRSEHAVELHRRPTTPFCPLNFTVDPPFPHLSISTTPSLLHRQPISLPTLCLPNPAVSSPPFPSQTQSSLRLPSPPKPILTLHLPSPHKPITNPSDKFKGYAPTVGLPQTRRG